MSLGASSCYVLRIVKDKGWFSSLGNGLIIHSRNGSSVHMGDATELPRYCSKNDEILIFIY